MSLINVLAKTISKKFDGYVDPDIALKKANSIVEGIKSNGADIGVPDMERYVLSSTDSYLGSKVGDTEVPLYDTQLGESIDSNLSVATQIQYNLEDLKFSFDKFKPRGDAPLRKDIPEIPEELRGDLENYLSKRIQETNGDSLSILSPEGKQGIGKYLLDDLLRDGDSADLVDDLLSGFPKKTKGVREDIQSVSPSLLEQQQRDVEVEFNKKRFLKDSKWTDPVYRADSNTGMDDRYLAGVLPREMGIHMGTSPQQAEAILIQAMDPKNSRLSRPTAMAERTQEDVDGYFKDLMPQYMRQQERIAQGAEERLDDIKMEPFSISKGYISVKNPLRMDDMNTGWVAGSLIHANAFKENLIRTVIAQSDKPIGPKALKELDRIQDKAQK